MPICGQGESSLLLGALISCCRGVNPSAASAARSGEDLKSRSKIKRVRLADSFHYATHRNRLAPAKWSDVFRCCLAIVGHKKCSRCADDVHHGPPIICGRRHKGSDHVGLSFVPSIVPTSVPKEGVFPKASTSENKQAKLLSHLHRKFFGLRLVLWGKYNQYAQATSFYVGESVASERRWPTSLLLR